MRNDHWLLPEGIEEVLPPRAAALEELRRQLLDLYDRWGYELIIPPFVEYVESLLSSAGGDLDLKTFKITDQPTGRQLGIRADITPQAARIDAHQLRRETPTRLCYLGTVLHTRSDGFAGSRAPMQVGAELYGHSGIESDLEILSLMMETLRSAGIEDLYLDLGHVGIFRSLAAQAELNTEQELELFSALQRKAVPEVVSLVREMEIQPTLAAMFERLPELSGDDALQRGREVLKQAGEEVQAALATLEQLASRLRARLPGISLHFDLAELRGYHYHTGVVFAAFAPGLGQEIARGGRYDHIGRVFGRARPACGFSADLRTLLRLGKGVGRTEEGGIFAPWSADPQLQNSIERLRGEGQRVVCGLPDQQGGAKEMGCKQVLEKIDDEWVVTTL
jgi:ATP phosphoribosyltransferase regulatory subunit